MDFDLKSAYTRTGDDKQGITTLPFRGVPRRRASKTARGPLNHDSPNGPNSRQKSLAIIYFNYSRIMLV